MKDSTKLVVYARDELRGDDARERLRVRAIPTIVVQDPDSREELGRIIEPPESGSLEADLLAIADRTPKSVLA